ncbi:FAD-dependent oxidoreductase [Alkalilimnicola sp. S0819]|uniref:FAD-dependent oxidoreductase n=1 Tax=Alkalilimnicola sp. S0819 TaxID=2613922 RepID=UPI001261660B|nr:FAD-dependent oxidoreductase [Alkalilimnicola sp. S0819]KAB7627591.1 pyridine nucleotide-disulfide oxidoreductase [Alkalilimnicola sp. S0819]MPQ15753.1 pyridine nucleotide-disulfide oxidoreductase [Alkalilimnicola sp. S0819]
MRYSRWFLLAALLIAVLAFFALDLGRYLSLDWLKAQQSALQHLVATHWLPAALAYFGLYVLVTALSLPGATIMTLAGGAVFGLAAGSVLVSFASTLGAFLAFLIARGLLRETVARRFGARLEAVDRGVREDGAFYLFTLRLVPIFPFFVVNLVMGLTAIRAWTYWWVSQLGMLPATLVYVNAGTQLAAVDSPGDILSPGLLFSFALLGIFPLLAKKGLTMLKTAKALSGHRKPRHFDRNLVVIGAGSGGLVASYIAAAVKARVTLIEKSRMGGDCLNTGCVPSKALIRTARFVDEARRCQDYGVQEAEVRLDFAKVMARIQNVVRQIEPHDSVERYQGLGVEVIEGEARITSPWTVEVNGHTLSTRAIVVAAGASPLVPPIPGLAEAGYLTSDTVWELREQPRRLLVLGGGPIGSELAQAFSRLGSQVIQVEMGERLLPREDPDIAERVQRQFRDEGIDLRLAHRAVEVKRRGEALSVVCEHQGKQVEIECDRILVALGRAARVEGYGLEELGVQLTSRHTLGVNDFMQTSIPTIYACGDVAGPYQFTHVASHQAWYASVNALFGSPLKRFRVDYRVIPWATFTDPEVARVGLSETEARERGIAYELTEYDLADLDRAIADGEARGVVKVLTAPGKDRILGATIVGSHAGELIAEFVLAMKHGLGLNKLLSTIHIYPTWAEANKYAAGVWRKAHSPEGLLRWLERFHRWRRG